MDRYNKANSHLLLGNVPKNIPFLNIPCQYPLYYYED